ncbi:MAG: pantoate--beta-alanine ligase [Gammaproteobacteria bacterium]|nr:pantoate--beta-alanine ligase [Gammaproteobacteria bacterium]
MQIITTINEMKALSDSFRKKNERIAFVPTMGNLHPGHIQLVERAETLAPKTIVSIFVNPLQFGANEDFDAYPRTLEHDRYLLELANVDALFTPARNEIYPDKNSNKEVIEFPGLSDILCGASRPGHFSGVAVVVKHLFETVQPDIAIFGEKDYQQVLVIKKLVAEYDLPVEIITIPTQRESDGLAMSSRNGYLSEQERQVAPLLYKTLCQARDQLRAKAVHFSEIEQQANEVLTKAGFKPDYFSIRHSGDLSEPAEDEKQLVILVAAYLGKTRLIDNILI